MSVKRNYAGYKLVKNTVLDYLDPNGTTTHTAVEIANATKLNVGSIRIAARYLNVILKPANRGGRRHPANQYVKKSLTTESPKATSTNTPNDL